MMKKIWRIRRDRSAVSPVIATILMVAVTVVLAAVLYIMVLGFVGGTPTNLSIALTRETSANGLSWVVQVGAVQGTAAKSDLTFRVMNTSGTAVAGTTMVMNSWTNKTGLNFSPVRYSETLIVPGDVWTLSKAVFIAGQKIQLLSTNQIVGEVVL